MDSGLDFIRPEFLDVLYIQQKNLVIFPYVDLKHLHSLETFTAGFNCSDLDSLALNNIKDILSYREYDTYSLNPNLYFILNVNKNKLEEIMSVEDVRCIINSNDNVSNLVNGENFIFYNKKNKSFLNYAPTNEDLAFARHLIADSDDLTLLSEKILNLKIASRKIFGEINTSKDPKNLHTILKDYDKKYWKKILEHVHLFFRIIIPPNFYQECSGNGTGKSVHKDRSVFDEEYNDIVCTNSDIAKEFIQQLHNFREKNVNPSNLELEQLYNPQKLYNYLRSHHWKQEFPEKFLSKWLKMSVTRYTLQDNDYTDFEKIFKKLNIPNDFILNLIERNLGNGSNPDSLDVLNDKIINDTQQQKDDLGGEIRISSIPSPSHKWEEFKKWYQDNFSLLKKILGDFGEG